MGNRSSWIVCGLLLLNSGVVSAGSCKFDSSNPTGNLGLIATMPLSGGNLTVGRDVPVGAEVYRQTYSPSSELLVTCNGITTDVTERNYFSRLPLPSANWNSGPYAGKVYQSGVPGIGVAIWRGASVLPYDWNWGNCTGWTVTCTIRLYPFSNSMTVSLIKTGPVSAGTVNGANFPSIARDLISDTTLQAIRVNFVGSINIVSRTCSTPDVSVPMGTHIVNEFSGKNTFTPWIDFNIALNNCPAFNGYYQADGPIWTGSGSQGTVDNLNSRKNNTLQVRLDPTLAAINPSQGILALNPSAQGNAPAATGVGLQVADSNGGPLSLAILHASGITPRAQEGASYSIPLKARYIQTEDHVTAGPANATATFTIDYY